MQNRILLVTLVKSKPVNYPLTVLYRYVAGHYFLQNKIGSLFDSRLKSNT